jgi:hypothetical protein
MEKYMNKFFDAVKALFPQGRAFQLFVENKKYAFIKSLCKLPESIRTEAERAYYDVFPDTTHHPEKWESVFGVLFTKAEMEKRRNILDTLWKIGHGGQSAALLQEILQKIDERILVVENTPVGNPRTSNAVITSVNRNKAMVCGNKRAINSFFIGNANFTPYILQNDTSRLYDIPNESKYWEMCFYVCASVVRNSSTNEIMYVNKLSIKSVWKNYIEYLILKIKPVHSTAVLFIEWIEGENL